MTFSRRQVIYAAGSAAAFLAFAIGVTLVNPRFAPAVIGAALVGVLVLVALVIDERMADRLEARTEEARALGDAMAELRTLLATTAPLPPATGYAIAPDSAVLLYRLLCERRPAVVVETGSGLSTLIIGYTLRRLGGGRLLTLELDATYAERTRAEVARHGLADLVTVVHAPLCDGEHGRWHDASALAEVSTIDFVFDDGPPRVLGPRLRAAALPMLAARLARDVVYLLNYIADEERANVAAWCARDPSWRVEWQRTRKGNAILRRG